MEKDIIIKDFQDGIAQSPHLGFADMRNLDITSIPGVAFPNYKTTKASDNNITGLLKWVVPDVGNDAYYGVDSDAKVYISSNGASWTLVSGNTTSSGDGDGIAVWKDYLFVARNSAIDVYGPLSGIAAWTNSWKTLTENGTTMETAYHPMVVASDDVLYIGNRSTVASVTELTTFAPGTAASFSYTTEALRLPSTHQIKCMAELGNRLMIGTWTSNTNVLSPSVASIYPWNKINPSFDDIPIQLAEKGVHQMITVDNFLYVVAGLEGAIYRTNGSSTVKIGKLPRSITGVSAGGKLVFFPGAITYHRDRIHFGVSSGADSYSGIGVWSIDPRTGVLNYEHQISTGTTTSTSILYISSLNSINSDRYTIGWRDNTTYGTDKVDTAYFTSNASYFISPLIPVGTNHYKKTLNQVEIILDRPLSVSGQSVRLSFRKNNSGAFTTINTLSYDTHGAVTSITFPAPIVDALFVQIKAEYSGTTPVYIKEIRIR